MILKINGGEERNINVLSLQEDYEIFHILNLEYFYPNNFEIISATFEEVCHFIDLFSLDSLRTISFLDEQKLYLFYNPYQHTNILDIKDSFLFNIVKSFYG